MANGDQGDWPAPNSLGEWVDDLRHQSDEFRVAIDALIAANCDRLKLAWLLSALSNAIRWQNISRDDLRGIVEELQRAAKSVRRLFFSQFNLFLPGLDTLRMEGELRDLARRGTELAPRVDGRSPMGRDLVRATLVNYVQRTTGQFHDNEVAPLISVIETLDQTQTYGDLIIAAPPVRDAPYTTEAHVQWRHRQPCQDFLNGPSQKVLALEAAMENDLREL
jgi:hypothetical protein